MRVEADLFSGRPNPAWTLDAAEAEDLADLLRLLPPGGAAPEPPGLGYRGMVVRGVEAALPGCTELRLFRGAAAAECAAGPRTFTDRERAVERWLVDSARRRLDPGLVEVLQGEVGSGL